MMDKFLAELDLLDRHLTVLELVIQNDPIGIVALSNETGYEHYEVRYSLRVLEEDGIIEPTKRGATVTAKATRMLTELPGRIDEIGHKIESVGAETTAAAD